jgi:hypothetical protein
MAHRLGEPVREQGRVRKWQRDYSSTVHMEDSTSSGTMTQSRPALIFLVVFTAVRPFFRTDSKGTTSAFADNDRRSAQLPLYFFSWFPSLPGS